MNMFIIIILEDNKLIEFLLFVKEKHQSVIDLEPFSGTPVQAHMRMQINMLIRKMDKFKYMSNFREALLPLFWFEESVVLPDFFIKELKGGHRELLLAK